MSYQFEFDRMRRILRASIHGVLGDDETTRFRAETASLLNDIRPNACIVDLSNTKQYEISSAKIGTIAKSAPALPGLSIPVIVVAPAVHMFGASRMFQILSDEKRPWLRVVRSCDEAYKLLCLDSPSFEPLPANLEERKKMCDSPGT
jgi:hypothetical protein